MRISFRERTVGASVYGLITFEDGLIIDNKQFLPLNF